MSRRLFWTLAACAMVAAAWQAWALRWTCDDAYISFRYARNFAEGHGLVFNLDPGEAPVEGYTNFAWTMWLAVGWWLGFTDDLLESWSIVSGVSCHAATVWLLASFAWRASGGRAVVPIAACGYAALHHASSLAPAGLETALFVLLATALLGHCLHLRCARQAWLAGCVGVLAAMTRPDGALFAAIAGIFVLHDAWRRRAPALLAGYCVPFLAVFVPYLLWRHSYYGYWVPNTFYAKAGGGLLGLGFTYVAEFAKCYYALLLAASALLWFLLRRPDLLAPVSPWLGRRPWLVVLAFTAPYLGFVVWAGGDFMFARFLLPILPALLLALDFACVRWRLLWLQPALGLLLAGGLLLRVEPPWLGDYLQPVSDNRRISVARMFADEQGGMPATEAFRRAGKALGTLFDGLDVRIGIGGGQANLAFRARVPVAVECAAGLTDAYLAHLPGKHRNKVAHNLDPSHYTGYLERRGVHFMFEGSYGGDDSWRVVFFPADTVDWSPLAPKPVPARLVVYDRDLMRELRRRAPNMVATDLEQHLDSYIAALPAKAKDEVRADYAKFRAAWFDHTPDPGREAAFERFLQGGG